jgi:hypothetical protein
MGAFAIPEDLLASMTLSSKRELIQAIRKVYGKSSKAQKSSHLDHLELAVNTV